MPRLGLAFFCSGFAALLCQIVWQRMLGIFAGSDTVSAALVVGAFLAGLGLGSILGAYAADRLPPARALVGFALCEAGVALCALVSKPFLYDWLALSMAGRVDAPLAVFALCFAGLVVPTTLMGASLPLLSRAIATSLDTLAERIGRLYGLNTLGAGLGALLGGWLVLGKVGFEAALGFAAALELAAAALALTLLPGLWRAARATAAPSRPAAAAAAEPAGPAPFGGLPFWCGLVFLSGYVIVALEIVWVRLLGQVGQFHAYLFPTVLGVFLLADGLGMAVAARMVRRMEDPLPAFLAAQGAGFVLAAVLVGALWLALPYWPLGHHMAVDNIRFYWRPMVLGIASTLAVVGPPAFLIGMTFPFAQRAVQRDLASVGARVGWVQLANIAGNAAGSLGTGLVTLHLLGTMGTMRLLAAVTLALLAGWLWRAVRPAAPRRAAEGRPARATAAALALGCVLAAVALPGNAAFWRRMHALPEGGFAIGAEDRSGVAFWRETAKEPGGDPGRFFIAGFAQGSVPFWEGHVLLGVLGPLLHPAPERVLAIGVGSGATPWGALVSPATREVRAVELVGPVLDVLRGIAEARPEGAVAELLSDPRLRLEYGDGRRALARGTELYDVIEADAILPQSSHSGLLYSAEFLQTVRARLKPGGLYVQWAPTARVAETFAAAFPHVVLLWPFGVLVGSDRPIPFDHAALLERLDSPEVLAHARRGNPAIRSLAALVAEAPQVWTPDTPRGPPPLTDMFPRDEFFANQPWMDPRRARPHPREAAR